MVFFLKIFIASSIGPLPMGGWPISACGRHGRVTCFGHWTVTWTNSPTSEQSFKSHFVVLHHQLFFILMWNSYILDRGCFYLEWKRHGTESNLDSMDTRNKAVLWATRIPRSLLPRSPDWWKNHWLYSLHIFF